jgi:hypothetical protein
VKGTAYGKLKWFGLVLIGKAFCSTSNLYFDVFFSTKRIRKILRGIRRLSDKVKSYFKYWK